MKMDEPYTRVPNAAIRSLKLDPYDKIVLFAIMSCGKNAFPGYKALMEWCQISSERLWKSLRKLDEFNLIIRAKQGRRVVYTHHWIYSPDEEIKGQPIRFTKRTTSPDEVGSIRQTNTIKNHDKESLIKRSF